MTRKMLKSTHDFKWQLLKGMASGRGTTKEREMIPLKNRKGKKKQIGKV